MVVYCSIYVDLPLPRSPMFRWFNFNHIWWWRPCRWCNRWRITKCWQVHQFKIQKKSFQKIHSLHWQCLSINAKHCIQPASSVFLFLLHLHSQTAMRVPFVRILVGICSLILLYFLFLFWWTSTELLYSSASILNRWNPNSWRPREEIAE